jgi:Raf kinase inhibitor-like YbhB/YbcL family protein
LPALTAVLPATGAQGGDPVSFTLLSPAFGPMQPIPSAYTCEGKNISPPLAWPHLPQGTRSLALIVDDPDAPDPKAPKTTWVHWVFFNLPPTSKGLAEGAAILPLPAGTLQGLNSWNRTGYGGPCPPIGRHRYFHRLYALDCVLTGLQQPSKSVLESAMKGHILAETGLVGTYEKKK